MKPQKGPSSFSEKHQGAFIGVCFRILIMGAGKSGGFLRCGNPAFSQITHHFSPGHFTEGALFDDLPILFFPEYTGDKPDMGRQVSGNTDTVFFGSQIEDTVGFGEEMPGKAVSPEGIEIFGFSHPEPGLHFETVGRHPVKGAQDAVKT